MPVPELRAGLHILFTPHLPHACCMAPTRGTFVSNLVGLLL